MDTYRGLARVRHAGGLAGYLTNFEHFPTERLTVIYLGNNTEMPFLDISSQIAESCLMDRLTHLPTNAAVDDAVTTPSSVVSIELDEYVGE
jgi:hypothetical protein